jgi:hypothetical protein
MATKVELPSITAELAAPRPRVNLKTLRPREGISDSVVDANSREIGGQWGASTRLQTLDQTTPLTSVRLDLPDYVDHQLKLKCVTDGGSKAYYILKALAKDGFDINETDLKFDRRKRGKRSIV